MTFRHIALQNVRRRWRDFLSYLISVVFSVVVFFVFVSLAYHPQFSELAANSTRLSALFVVSAILVGIFTVLFLWYSSSLFFQRRYREVGTYLLLGMRRRSAAGILFLESLLVGLAALGAGIVLGIVLRRLFLLALVRMMTIPMELEVLLNPAPVVITTASFVGLFALGGLAGVFGVLRYQLVRLFAAEQEGEEKPEKPWLQLGIAVGLVGVGYWMAIQAQPGSVSIRYLAIITLVTVAGTFFLFSGGGYLILRLAKVIARRAADPARIVAVGQLVFRIRRNARFLALVAVLNAVAIASVGTFFTIREERSQMFQSIEQMSPFDFSFLTEEPREVADQVELLRALDADQEPSGAFARVLTLPEPLPMSEFSAIGAVIARSDYQPLARLRDIAPAPPLEGREIMLVARTGAPETALRGRTIAAPDGSHFTIVASQTVQLFSFDRVRNYLAVVSDELFANLAADGGTTTGIGVIEVARPRESWDLLVALDERLPPEADLIAHVAVFGAINGVTGILLFVGAFIGVMLILSNGSIIFFRSLMEANESRARFRILDAIGCSDRERRRAIRTGQLALFGAPFLVGFVHALVALVMLASLIDIPTIGAHLVVSTVYGALYLVYLLVTDPALK